MLVNFAKGAQDCGRIVANDFGEAIAAYQRSMGRDSGKSENAGRTQPEAYRDAHDVAK